MKKQSQPSLSLIEKALSLNLPAYTICSYLTNKDILSFSNITKHVYNSLSENNIYTWILLSKENTNFSSKFFLLQNRFELMNKEAIDTISIITDNIFNEFFNQTNRMIKCYYLSIMIFGFDAYSLVITFAQIEKGAEYLTQIPFIFNWVSSIVCLLVYTVRASRMKKRIRNIIMDNKTKFKGVLTEANIKDLTHNLKLRTKSRKPTAFRQAAIAYIIFYFPILVRICMVVGSYKKAFYAASSMIFIYLFLSTLVMIIMKKIKHRKTKIKQYNMLMGEDETFKAKMRIIQDDLKPKSTSIGDTVVTLFFLLMKLVYYFLLIIYLDCLGAKLDGETDAISWFALFSPVYLLNVFVISWGILHCCSLKNLPIRGWSKGVLYVSLLFIILCLCLNAIFIPMKLENILEMSYIWSALCFIVGTISIVCHYVILCRKKIEIW